MGSRQCGQRIKTKDVIAGEVLSPPEEGRSPPIVTRMLNRGRVLYEKRFRLVPTKDQHLHGQQQCLHSENNGMDQANGIDHV